MVGFLVKCASEPLGKYTVQANSASGTENDTFSIKSPPHPFMTISCIGDFPEGNMILAGFQPDEEVLMAEYEGNSSKEKNLVNYWYQKVRADGRLVSTYERSSDRLVVAIGQDLVTTKTSDVIGGEAMRVSAYDYFFTDCLR
jgi:hypothetical protein